MLHMWKSYDNFGGSRFSLWVPGMELRGQRSGSCNKCLYLWSHLTDPHYCLLNLFIFFERVSPCLHSLPGSHCATRAGFQVEPVLLPSALTTGARHYIYFSFVLLGFFCLSVFSFFFFFKQQYGILDQFMRSG